MLQTHYKAADPLGDCRSDLWFTHQLAKRLKKQYADSTLPRDEGFKHLTWDFDAEPGKDHGDTAGAPSSNKIMKEVNGYVTDDPGRHLAGFGELKDDGSTTCASWIYCGVFPAPDKNLADRRTPDPPDKPGAQLAWGWAWPANRRLLYNRASADLKGQPWSEQKKWVWWDGEKWTGYDVPDFAGKKAPDAAAKPDGIGLDGLSGTDPFIMKTDGKGWLFVPAGLVDGPLPTHYEPAESPVKNPLYKQQASPVYKYWKRDDNPLAPVGDPTFPIIMTTYRLTEHYLAGAMSRWNPWLTELQPEVFVEMSPELAQEKGVKGDGSRFARFRPPGLLGSLVAILGGVSGALLAGYTGVLLSVTNRPIWADTTLLGLVLLVSAASTSAALLILLGAARVPRGGIRALARFARGRGWRPCAPDYTAGSPGAATASGSRDL